MLIRWERLTYIVTFFNCGLIRLYTRFLLLIAITVCKLVGQKGVAPGRRGTNLVFALLLDEIGSMIKEHVTGPTCLSSELPSDDRKLRTFLTLSWKNM